MPKKKDKQIKTDIKNVVSLDEYKMRKDIIKK